MKQLAERRTDIFGVGDEETVIGKKLGEEETRKDERVTWDGHTSSVEAATRAARANITLEDQIHQIHKVKGLLPDEEKEKIGPKPVIPGSMPHKQPHIPPVNMMGQSQIIVPPKPPQIMPPSPQSQSQMHPVPAPPVMMMQMRPPMMRKTTKIFKFSSLYSNLFSIFCLSFNSTTFPNGIHARYAAARSNASRTANN